MKRFLLNWGPVVGWCLIIFWLSSIPHLAVSTGWKDFWTRKPAHAVEYASLFVLVYRALVADWSKEWRVRMLLLAAVLVMVYAATDEFHQSLVPSRMGHIEDWFIDSLGIFMGLGFLKWYQWWSKATHESNAGH